VWPPKQKEAEGLNQKKPSAAAAKDSGPSAVAGPESFAPEKKNGEDPNDSCGNVNQKWVDSLQPDFPKLDVRYTVKDCQTWYRQNGKPEPNRRQIIKWLRSQRPPKSKSEATQQSEEHGALTENQVHKKVEKFLKGNAAIDWSSMDQKKLDLLIYNELGIALNHAETGEILDKYKSNKQQPKQ
jgi:hypothetical protein